MSFSDAFDVLSGKVKTLLLDSGAGHDYDHTLRVMKNAELLAYAARAAANMFDPEAVILGGDVLEFGDRHFEHFKEECARFSEARKLGKSPLILRSNFGKRGVAVGGAQLILDELVF